MNSKVDSNEQTNSALGIIMGVSCRDFDSWNKMFGSCIVLGTSGLFISEPSMLKELSSAWTSRVVDVECFSQEFFSFP
jgi:hypothetical protein